ncbi:MAG: DUF2752 domain-containing protein [Planctomyces sp.]
MTSEIEILQHQSELPGRRGRWLLVIVISAVFLTGWMLSPDDSGSGTHRQLGLPECLLLQATGVRCPTCGMTTAFSHFVRGHWLAALQANPAGALLALGLAICWPLLVLSLTGHCVAPGTWLMRRLPVLVMGWLALAGGYWLLSMLKRSEF